MNNLENKRNTLQSLIKEFHMAIKKLGKFIKNAKKFNKICKLDRLALILYEFNTRVTHSIDQLYLTHHMCKMNRTPNFEVEKTVKVIFDYSHLNLKKKIATSLIPIATREKKEKLFYFLEKCFYGENLTEKDVPIKMEKLRQDAYYILQVENSIIKLQNLKRREFLKFEDNNFYFYFGEICFKILTYSYEVENMNYLTYYCSEIKLSDNQKYFVKTTEWIKKYIQYLNESLIFPNLKIEFPNINQINQVEDKQFDLKLKELQQILKNFTSKYIFKNIFIQIKNFLKEYVSTSNNIKAAQIVVNTQSEIKIKMNYLYTTNSYEFNLILDNSDIIDHFRVNISNVIVNDNPFLAVDNYTQKISFCQLDNFNLEKMISQKIRDFQKIHLNFIYEKLKLLKSKFIPYKLTISEDNSKITFSFDKYMLFSIVLDSFSNLHIIDYEYIFGLEDSIKIRDWIILYLNIGESNYFDRFIIEHFIEIFFKFKSVKVTFEVETNFLLLKFLILDNNLIKKQSYLNIPINILPGNKINLTCINIEIINNYNNETDFNHLLPYSINEKFTICTLNKILGICESTKNAYEDRLRNIMETLTFTKNITFDQKITIKTCENIENFNDLIENENVNFFLKLVKEINLESNNLVFRVILDESHLKSIFPVLSNYSIMDNDCVINFDSTKFVISFYFLTKMTVKVLGDISPYRKLFKKYLGKIIKFILLEESILKSEEMVNIFKNSAENIIVSPIAFQFKYKFLENYSKTILFQFVNTEKKIKKIYILPLEYHMNNSIIFENYIRAVHESDDHNFVANLKKFLFFSAVYLKLINSFIYFSYPVQVNIYESLMSYNKTFVLFKDFKTFHILNYNKLSLFIEVENINTLVIYSSYNTENCFRFMNSIVSSEDMHEPIPENVQETHIQVKKKIVLRNESQFLLKDLEMILDYVKRF